MSNRSFFREHRKLIAGLGLALVLASLAAGAALLYRYRTGPDSVFSSLRTALAEGDKAALASLMDFRSLSADIVQAVFTVYPQSAAQEKQKTDMQDEAQRLALKALTDGKDAKSETAQPRKLFEAAPFVPADVFAQLAAGMTLEKAADGAQILSRFTHHKLQTDFPVQLRLERRQGEWKVTRLLNAQELVKLYKDSMAALLAADEVTLAEKNEKIMSRMRAHFHEPQCLASAQQMGSKHEVMLVIKVTANNKETTTLHSVNLLCELRASNGAPVYSRQVEAVQRVFGGGAFSNTWTMVLDADSGDAVKLLQAGPLSCTVEPKVMSVGVGEILYPRKD